MSRPRPQTGGGARPALASRGARLTARDYKSSHGRPFELRRLREFAYGALAGAVLTAMAFTWIGGRHRALETPDAPRPDPHRSARAAAAAADASGKPAEKYDFYEMLPNFEVVVPEKDKEVKRDLPAAARIDRPGVYVLQAGSYRNEADANRVRAQLALQGITATVQRVAVDADVWHRVRIGPINNLDELNKLRRQLQAADVDALVIRVGD
ncbi:MAG TPA: SPOR domain-containing protein [Steroidobacteraceae bacterium]|nr:SPOR domain-containing protein [Steroidobacteraceae bacterium]